MKNVLIGITLIAVLAGCMKSKDSGQTQDPCVFDTCTYKAPASEIQAVQQYLASTNITNATQHCSGLFYRVETPGTGKSPKICSYIKAKYIGRLTNGTVFDQGTFQEPYELGGLILGWINSLPMLKEGGKIHLYIPPSLGYGNRATGSIPANSILIFEVELISVQ